MTKQIKLHDGIVGGIMLLAAILAWQVDPRWIFLVGLTAAIMVSSAFTGFCPVHYVIGRFTRP